MHAIIENSSPEREAFLSVNSSTFWRIADNFQDKTLREAGELFSYLCVAPPNILREILTQYRYFTVYYIPDLALLVARLEDGPMRSFLADILFDELGSGKARLAHPQLYDDFLATIGVNTSDLASQALEENIALLDEARRRLVDGAHGNAYAIGLRGMGGECVCQVYIAQLYECLMKNPYIQANKSAIDWRFWDMHVGDHDIEHREKTRALIDSEIVARGGSALTELGDGYVYSMEQWKEFWTNIFEMRDGEPAGPKFPRTTVKSSVNVKVCNQARCPTANALMN
jgi:hypothetical protein